MARTKIIETAAPASKLQETLDLINKEHGSNSVMILSQKDVQNIEVISTGSLDLDDALGVGGLPKGRVIEIYGPESSGKTTLATHIIAEAQKLGGVCAFIDAEHAFDSQYAEKLGVDIDRLIINQPDYGEQALEIADKLISSGCISVCVIDSVAALVPKAELDGEMGESKMGLHARLMSQALRKITGNTKKNNVILIFINQLRDKIGVMFGSPETTTGGNALKFYASVRLDVRRSLTTENAVIEKGEKIGNLTTVKVVKNKVAPPFKKAEFNIVWGEGIDKIGEIIEKAAEKNIIKKWGKQITDLESETKYDIEEYKTLINDNEDFKTELLNKIKNK